MRNRYIFPERGASSFSDLPVQMLRVLGAGGAFGFEELHSACNWVWLYDWFPPSGQKPSSDFRCAPTAWGHRHLEDFCALPVVWTESRLTSPGVNGSVLWRLPFNYFASEWCWEPMVDHLWDIWIIMLHPQWLLTSFEMECFYWIIIYKLTAIYQNIVVVIKIKLQWQDLPLHELTRACSGLSGFAGQNQYSEMAPSRWGLGILTRVLWCTPITRSFPYHNSLIWPYYKREMNNNCCVLFVTFLCFNSSCCCCC